MHYSIRWALGSLLITAGYAHAATGVDLSITATTNPAGCNIVLNNGGQVDYGTLQRSDLNASGDRETPLPDKTIGWSINCDYPVPIAVQWADNHAAYGSLPTGTQYFSMGKDAKGAPVGAFELYFGDIAASADGNPVPAISRVTGDSSAAWIPNIDGVVDSRYVLGFAAPGTGVPGAFATYSGQIRIAGRIAPLNTLDATRVININGSATIEIIYL